MRDEELFEKLSKLPLRRLRSIARRFGITSWTQNPRHTQEDLADAIWFEIGINVPRDKLEMILKPHRKKHKKITKRRKPRTLKHRHKKETTY